MDSAFAEFAASAEVISNDAQRMYRKVERTIGKRQVRDVRGTPSV